MTSSRFAELTKFIRRSRETADDDTFGSEQNQIVNRRAADTETRQLDLRHQSDREFLPQVIHLARVCEAHQSRPTRTMRFTRLSLAHKCPHTDTALFINQCRIRKSTGRRHPLGQFLPIPTAHAAALEIFIRRRFKSLPHPFAKPQLQLRHVGAQRQLFALITADPHLRHQVIRQPRKIIRILRYIDTKSLANEVRKHHSDRPILRRKSP